MKTVGITGGIGSGKSLVCAVLETLDVPVFYADAAAKELMKASGPLAPSLRQLFGQEVYEGEQLNRRLISEQVFAQPPLLQQLNALVHPATQHAWRQWRQAQSGPYVVKEAAIFFESGTAGDLDLMVLVDAPMPLRLLRTMKRDGLSREQVIQRMDKQLAPGLLQKLCDVVVVNDECTPLLPQILALDLQLRASPDNH